MESNGSRDRSISPELKAIEAQLWAEADPHQRVAALLIGRATGQEDLPHILAELRTVDIKDALGARLVAVRMTEAACKCVEALAKHRSGGATEHRVMVTHTGPATEVDVGVRLRRGGEGDGRGGRGRGGGNEH